MMFAKSDEAISPVIGVILMVAITVILSAIIGGFTFGMIDPIGNTKSVAATAQQSIPDIIVTYSGGPDAGKVDCILADVDDLGLWEEVAGSCSDLGAADAEIGSTYVFSSLGTVDYNHVVVVAKYVDGTEQAILDTFV